MITKLKKCTQTKQAEIRQQYSQIGLGHLYITIIRYNIQIIKIGKRKYRNTGLARMENRQKNQSTLDQIQSNPYELVKLLNRANEDLKKQIAEYEMALDSMFEQKEILYNENKKLQGVVSELKIKIDVMRKQKQAQNFIIERNIQSKVSINNLKYNLISPSNRKLQYTNCRPFEKMQMKSGVFDSKDIVNINTSKRLEEHINDKQQEDYIPQPIKLNSNNKLESSLQFKLKGNFDTIQRKDYRYAEHLFQSFFIIGPDIMEFKKKRMAERGKQQIEVQPATLYTSSRFYKQNKVSFLNEISKRAFSVGCKLYKKQLEQNEELFDILQYKPHRIISEDLFVFTLKGDESLFIQNMKNPNFKKSYVHTVNPNYFLFIVCMKIPDFVHVRDQRNYQRKQNEVWLTEKVYAIATYYPFFHVYVEVLNRIHSIITKRIIHKIIIENQNILSWNITKSIYDLEKSNDINEILTYFSNKKPDFNQVCINSNYYFGTFPQFGFKSIYSMALHSCPMFFSNFSYQEMLLMLTAIFCQKTLVFISKSETIATFSALFLINLISPFQYSSTLLLNCDMEKVKQMIFEFPFPLICSIKKTPQNLQQILSLFALSNLMRIVQNDAQYILIDVDSNSILYHQALDKLFHECIVNPSKQIRQAYLKVNSCQSKSFSLPKQLLVEDLKIANRVISEHEKRLQQKKKMVKQYIQKISTNQTKILTYRRTQKHEELLKLLTNYVKQFTINPDNDYDLINKINSVNKNNRIDIVKSHLLQKNKSWSGIISKFVESQMYANYLDEILKSTAVIGRL